MTRLSLKCIGSLAMFVFAAPAFAGNEDDIKQSVARAIDYLKRNHKQADAAGGGAPGARVGDTGMENGYMEGPPTLACIALMEAGVPASDRIIQEQAKVVRDAIITQRKTYQLALDIIFLDKIGEEIDSLLIQQAAARLVMGQSVRGGWTYNVPTLTANEQTRYRGSLGQAVLKGGKEIPQVGADVNNRPKLDSGVADILQGKNIEGREALLSVPQDDNSNTQFALIALWAARRHGVPVDNALQVVEKRFRNSQQRNGGWTYVFNSPYEFSPSMTCCGLLALAITSGFKSERSMKSKGSIGADGKLTIDPSRDAPKAISAANDRQVKGGLDFLGAVIAAAKGKPGAGPMGPGAAGGLGGPMGGVGGGLPPPPVGAGGGGPAVAGGGHGGGDPREDLYFMWSFERVCVVFNLKTVGGKDWHAWGADYLVHSQRQDGSWAGKYPGVVDTSFALMFMCRSNIVRDLSRLMKGGAGDPTAAIDPKKPGDKPATPAASAAEAEAAALAKALVAAGASKQLALIKEYTTEKGGKYSRALAEAIPQLKGETQTAARDGLAERMSRLSAKSLEGYLDDTNSEMVRAAALGAAMRDEKTLIPKLIVLLDDEAEIVWRGARLALRTITGKDFGPKPGDNDQKRAKAVADWRDWFKTQK